MDNAVWLLGVFTSLSLRTSTYISDSAISGVTHNILNGLVNCICADGFISMHDPLLYI